MKHLTQAIYKQKEAYLAQSFGGSRVGYLHKLISGEDFMVKKRSINFWDHRYILD
jgi:hypothetical protein